MKFFIFLLCTALSLFAHSRIGSEADIFWHLTAGEEIWTSHTLNPLEHWSSTAGGTYAPNFQWLYTVLIYFFHKYLGGYTFLPTLRAIIFGGILVAGAALTRFSWTSFILVPILLYAGWHDIIELRPDLFCTLLFAILLLLIRSEKTTGLRRFLWIFGILLFWANLHAGTAAIGIGLVGSAALFGVFPETGGLVGRLLVATLASLTLIMTPIGTNIFSILRANVIQENPILIMIPDMWGIHPETLLNWRSRGLSSPFWLSLSFLTLLGYTHFNKFPGFFRSPDNNRLFIAVAGTGLTALGLKLTRTTHYQVLFLLPVLSSLLTYIARHPKKWVRTSSLTLAFSAVSLFLGERIYAYGRPPQLGLDETLTPNGAIEFIKAEKPKTHLFNYHDFGSYLIRTLPEYPVSTDSRCFPYQEYFDQLAALDYDRPKIESFLRQHNFNTVLNTPPNVKLTNSGVPIDSHDSFFPKKDWALVYFDNQSVVYVRRIPEHNELISRKEYRFILRYALPDTPFLPPARTELFKNLFEYELDRCLEENPNTIYCVIGKMHFLVRRKQREEAIRLYSSLVQSIGTPNTATNDEAQALLANGACRQESESIQ